MKRNAAPSAEPGMKQRVGMIMIGAANIAALCRFYEDGLGWTAWRKGGSGSTMYKVGASVLVFIDGSYLAAERGEPMAAGSRQSLAVFVESQAEVDLTMAKALDAGAAVTSAARPRDGNMYSGYFNDPEGNSWEVVFAPRWLNS
jgi:catechol 2,3-dioxygenase-like lactoylglutathione lyase family enzyme